MIDETGKQKILIVDDSEMITQMLTETLKDSYVIVTSTNGQKALESFSRSPS